MNDAVYLDNNATTEPLDSVLSAVQTCTAGRYANPSSAHQAGQAVRHDVECARQEVARLIGADPREMVFTSGGTESINLAVTGALGAMRRAGCGARRRIVTTTVEHAATMAVLDSLEHQGYQIERIGVDAQGRIDRVAWREAMREDTAIATFLHVNNETGVVFDVADMAQAAADCGALVHVDAVQSVGKLAIDVARWPVQLLSLSAHKFHGPKGVGALFARRRTRLEPMLLGGHQERGLRGGTENVPGIIGMSVAARAALASLDETMRRIHALRDRLESGILETIPTARVIAAEADRIHNTTNIAFEHLGAEGILILLGQAEVYASAGAACSSGSLEPSHVLTAMGLPEPIAHGAIRFSLSKKNTEAQIDRVIHVLPGIIAKLSALSH